MLPIRSVLSYSKQVEELASIEIRPILVEDFGNYPRIKYPFLSLYETRSSKRHSTSTWETTWS